MLGPRAGRKVLSLQTAASRAVPMTQPLCANTHGFSLHAGLLAAAGATAIGFLIARQVFELAPQVNHWVWLAGPLLGVACVAVNMVAGARAALNQPPLIALREV